MPGYDRGDHENTDTDNCANDAEIDHENCGPARDLLPHQTFAFDGVDERGQADCHERADIDEHQRVTDFPERPADANRERQADECVTDQRAGGIRGSAYASCRYPA